MNGENTVLIMLFLSILLQNPRGVGTADVKVDELNYLLLSIRGEDPTMRAIVNFAWIYAEADAAPGVQQPPLTYSAI